MCAEIVISGSMELSIITRMLGRRLFQNNLSTARDMRLLLVVVVLFALWHVSQHDLQFAMDDGRGGHCEICRLNHMPSVGGAAQVLFAAIFMRTAPLVIVDAPHLRSKSYLPRLARGPPSF